MACIPLHHLTMTDHNTAALAAEIYNRRLARASAVGFAEYIDVPGRPAREDDDCEDFLNVESKLAEHHKLILSEVEACHLKPYGRLMIFMPPGSAKSTYASVIGPTYLMGKYPKTRIGLFSYGGTLAKKFGRRSRSVIKQKRYRNVFPEVELSADSSAANEFTLTNGSEYMAAGILGAATGNRFNNLFIDDPVKGREDADSETIRNKTWDAYEDDLKTRLIPGGSVVIIMCMTGDTLVRMADMSERALRDIRPGDLIATYDDGQISHTTVKNWIDQGPDDVFEIKMKSDMIVKANERHPFLVDRQGYREWVRLKNLKVGDKIVKVMPNGEHTKASLVNSRDAINLQSAKGSATLTTTKQDGQTEFAHHPHLTQNHDEQLACAIDTKSNPNITTSFSNCRTDDALVVDNCQLQMYEHIGVASCALTTIMQQGLSEACSATTATSWLDTEKQPMFYSRDQSIWNFTLDTVLSITPAGRENVFDIQVDRTENFIANGLVSHNTRWHEDDLAGRILPDDWNGESGEFECKDGNTWRVLCLQAECATDSDPLGRKIGQMLWQEWFTPEHWAQFRSNSRTWGALCQQIPRPADGNMFKPDKIELVDALPTGYIKWVRGWDLAATEGGGKYTAGVRLGVHRDSGKLVIHPHIVHGQWGPGNRDEQIKQAAIEDGRAVTQDIPDDPGAGGTAQTEYIVKKLRGYPVVWGPESGDKGTRAMPVAAEVNVGNVMMVKNPLVRTIKEELRSFPNGTYTDLGDALSRAYARLFPTEGKITINRTLLNKVRGGRR